MRLHTIVSRSIVVCVILCAGSGLASSESAVASTAAPEPTAEATTGIATAKAEADASAPRKIVEALHGTLIEIMREADDLGFDGRVQRSASRMDQTFDLPFMARATIGAAWKELDDQQQAEWTALFRRISASNYAENFSGFSGEFFETLETEPAARGTVWVRTKLILEDDEVKLDYRLKKNDEGWRIIDIQLEGKISEIALRRADYRSVIQRDGFDQLVVALREKADKQAAENQ